MNTITINTLLIAFLLVLTGCAAPVIKGPDFTLDDSPVNDKGKVYVYWNKVNGEATRQDFTINANNKPLRTMIQGGYFVFYSPVGELVLTSPANFTYGSMALLDLAFATTEELKFNVEAGETYFVNCNLAGYRGSYRLPMALVQEEQGLSQIKTTKLLPDDGKKLSEIAEVK